MEVISFMNKKVKCCTLMIVFAMLVIMITTPAGASDDGQDMFVYKTGNATVNVSGLSLRSGPGTEFPVLSSIGRSQAVKIVGQVGEWYAVYDYSSGQIGFVSGNYITTVTEDSKNDPKVPEGEAPSITGQDAQDAISDDANRLMRLTNSIRQQSTLNELEYSSELSKVAYAKAKDMVEHNYFSHESPTFGSPFEMMKTYGIPFTSAAENIAGNQTVDGAFYAWMESESHRSNVLGEYTKTGIGVYTSPVYGKIIVQMFLK